MANIDPGFQAAPYLGDSSFDPIDFVKRHNFAKFQQLKYNEEKRQSENAKTLNDMLFDVKAWEDQSGMKEIMQDRNKVLQTFMDYSRKGMNLGNPKTTEEQVLYKGLQDALASVKNKADIWQQQKGIYDFYQKQVDDPNNEDKIDKQATMQNIQNVLKSNDILDRQNKLQNLIVKKPVLADVHKYVRDNAQFITKPDVITTPVQDPTTGQTISQTREVVTPEIAKKQEADLRNLWASSPKEVKQAVTDQRKNDPTLGVMKDEDYFVSMYNPKYKERMVDKLSGTSGAGFSMNFGGQKVTMEPGYKSKVPQQYGGKTYSEPYIIGSKQSVTIPLNGAIRITPQGEVPIRGTGNLEAKPFMYDPDTDRLFFRSTGTNETPGLDNNDLVAVPRTSLPEDANNIPIRDDETGAMTTIGKKYGQVKAPKVRTIGGKDYSNPLTPYIPKNR